MMTKKLGLLFSAFLLFNLTDIRAQSFDLSSLDNAVSMLDEGKKANVTGVLSDAIKGLTSEAKASDGNFAPKILSQLGSLAGMIPGLASGKFDVKGIQKIVGTLKALVAANRLKKMLGGGSLLGKGKEVGANAGILQKGLDMLGSSQPEIAKASKLLGIVGKKAPKLDKSGLFSKLANKAISKKLGSTLDLLGGLL